MWGRRPKRTCAYATAACSIASFAATPARAYEFDAASGRLVGGGSLFSDGFEGPGGLPIAAYDVDWNPVDAADLAARYVSSPGGLEGRGAFRFGGAAFRALVGLAPVDAIAQGRRVEVRLWYLAGETMPAVWLLWARGNFILAGVPMQPSGRGTDDGWRELTTGPFDFEIAGLAPSFLLATDRQLDGASTTNSVIRGEPSLTLDPSASALLDALDVRDLGPALTTGAACSLANQASTCGAAGACLYGRCVDAAVAFGQPPQNNSLRGQYLDRLEFELATFAGSRHLRAKLPSFFAELEALRAAAAAATFWPTVLVGYRGLDDPHAHAPIVTPAEDLSTGICLQRGEADLVEGGGPAPMVFSTDAANPIAASLALGDVLTSVDGMSVAAWTSAAALYLDYAGDPAAAPIWAAPALMTAAARTGAKLEFTRCTAPGVCRQGGPGLTVDLAASLGALVWGTGELPLWATSPSVCGDRFTRYVGGPHADDADDAFSTDDGPVRVLQFNGFPGADTALGAAWEQVVKGALAGGPPLVLVDERTGEGGDPVSLEVMTDYFVNASPSTTFELVPALTGPLDAEGLATFRSCAAAPPGSFLACDYYEQFGPTARGAAAASRVAVLTGRDVSGNDFFSYSMAHRPAQTRLFGPGKTAGGFGSILFFAALGGEIEGATFQDNDALTPGPFDLPPGPFLSGQGVGPDVVLMQTQSDAIKGRDTLIEAAKAWLLAGGG